MSDVALGAHSRRSSAHSAAGRAKLARFANVSQSLVTLADVVKFRSAFGCIIAVFAGKQISMNRFAAVSSPLRTQHFVKFGLTWQRLLAKVQQFCFDLIM